MEVVAHERHMRTVDSAGPLVRVSGLGAGYDRVRVVRELSLEVSQGEIVAFIGPNGAGKTTTLLTLAGALPKQAGEIELMGHALSGTSSQKVARLGVSLLPQDRGLSSALSVADNLSLLRGRRRDRQALLDQVLVNFPALASPSLRRRPVSLLSGGEQQMLAIARCVVTRPKILLLDEMSMGLAPLIVRTLLGFVRQVATRQRMVVLVVEQHAGQALARADRGLVLRQGAVVLSAAAEELRAQPELLASA